MSTQTAYADVEIHILERQERGYPVDITVNYEREFQGFTLDPAKLPQPLIGDPQQEGERLFQWFCTDANFVKAWSEVRGAYPRCRLRLRIDATAPELHALPWELLREVRDGQVAQDLAASLATPFSRYLAGAWQPGSPILKRPIRVLVAIANPINLVEYKLQAVEVAREFALLQEATRGLAVELVALPQPCTLTALQKAIKEGVHILHFIGHGSYSQREQTAALLMADDNNQVRLVKDVELAEMLVQQLAATDIQNDNKLRLVFLASCQTATRSPADAFRGFAPQLIQAGVPAVLAMQDLVPVETARTFAQTFYHQLLQHGQVDVACNEARSVVLNAKLPGAAIPVLFMRLRDGLLLTQPGQITRIRPNQADGQSYNQENDFWKPLLSDIADYKCIPFLGPQVLAGVLSDRATLAAKLAEEFYPGAPNQTNLVQVAQYAALNDPAGVRDNYLRLLQDSLVRSLGLKFTPREMRQFAGMGLTGMASELKWSEKVRTLEETEVHHLLADLELPLYVTTNPDNFMTEALKAHGASPQRVGMRWKKPEDGQIQWVLKPDPSPGQPVVFHLTGFHGDPEQQQNLVLSEDDYMTFLVRLTRDQDQLMPTALISRLANHCFLFLGYQLEDWEFRTILLGIINQIPPAARKMHVGVQLDPTQTAGKEKTRKYLELYLNKFNITIYWGTPKEFMRELHNRWQAYLDQPDDN